MEHFTHCELCKHPFTKAKHRIPTLLGTCGHTFCHECVEFQLQTNHDNTAKLCQMCGQWSQNSDIAPNPKVLKIVEIWTKPDAGQGDEKLNDRLDLMSVRSQDVAVRATPGRSEFTDVNRVFCFQHQDKQIEYFCRSCHVLVCPKCMFEEHNGHELATLEDVTNVIRQNAQDFSILLENTSRINTDNKTYLTGQCTEIDRMREAQLQFIDQGFDAVIARLQQKRETLKEQFNSNYQQEMQTFQAKVEQSCRNQEEIDAIDLIFQQLMGFIERSSEAKILTKINDVSDFMNKSIEDLERITQANGVDKSELQINEQLQPLRLNVDKVFDLITRFNMLPNEGGSGGVNGSTSGISQSQNNVGIGSQSQIGAQNEVKSEMTTQQVISGSQHQPMQRRSPEAAQMLQQN